MNCQSENQQTEMMMPNTSELQFRDLFDLAEIQRIQDAFSRFPNRCRFGRRKLPMCYHES